MSSDRTAWLLVQAARHIVEHGHYRGGDFADVTAGPAEATACCAQGAINVVVNGIPWETTDEAREAVDAVETWLHDHLGRHVPIDAWSDESPTGHVVNGLLTVALREHTVWSDGTRTLTLPLLSVDPLSGPGVWAHTDDGLHACIEADAFFRDYRPVAS